MRPFRQISQETHRKRYPKRAANDKAAAARAGREYLSKNARPGTHAAQLASPALPEDGSIPDFLKRAKPIADGEAAAEARASKSGKKEAALRKAREQHLADAAEATKVKPLESPTTNAHAKDKAQAFLDKVKADDEAARRKNSAFKNGKAEKAPKLTKAQAKDKREGKPVVQKDRTRFDWKGAEEAAKRGKLPPKLDFSADTHARFREKLHEVEALAAKKDIAGLRKAKWPGFESSSPKAIHRWRDICIAALSAK
jgi:hypothetical protein